MSVPYPLEPFQIKMTAPIRVTTREEREAALTAADYNLFKLRSRDVMVDLLTDSGTGAMSQAQWGAMLQGDEAYAGSESFVRFEETVREFTGYRHVIPTHQGRGAEALFFAAIGVAGKLVPSNTHFDTTRANIEVLGGTPVDLPCRASADPHVPHPFKGNIDCEALEELLSREHARVPCVLMTLTNNAAGGQPASLGNVSRVRELADHHGIPFYLDACRLPENAFLARRQAGPNDPERRARNTRELIREFFARADGCLVSGKKDALGNIGGFLATDSTELAKTIRGRMVVTEGFPTYGGLAGRDLEALAVGLLEGTDEDYLAYRTGVVAWLTEELLRAGVPVVVPPGGHAVFVDARRFLPHIPPREFPGQALACALYVEGGVRSVEIGTLMFGEGTPHDFVRLAIPHRIYTRGHLEHVLLTFADIARCREDLPGYRVKEGTPHLRHFTASLEPLPDHAGHHPKDGRGARCRLACAGGEAPTALPGSPDRRRDSPP